MEARLREYRALRRRKELIDNAKETLEKTKEKVVNFLVPKIIRDMGGTQEEEVLLLESEEEVQPKKVPITSLIMDDSVDAMSETSETESLIEYQKTWKCFASKWTVYSVLWLSLYGLFLKLQFGAVFFVVSALIAIYYNTRTRPKRNGEISAYSVFNKDCVSIDGTLKAEQFEKEIRYGAGTVRS